MDWYAKRFVEIHVNYFIFNPLPIPRPSRNTPLWNKVVELAGRLACPDKRFAEWATAIGVDYGPLESEKKEEIIYELDAIVSHLYNLSESQVIHIFKTFHKNWNYNNRLNKVLKYYKLWENNF